MTAIVEEETLFYLFPEVWVLKALGFSFILGFSSIVIAN